MNDGSGRSWSYGYDSGTARHETSYVDAAGKTTWYEYTGNLLTKIIDPLGQRTLFTYDSSDRVLTVKRITDWNTQAGPTWTFAYDDAAGSTTLTDPNSHTWTYTQGSNDGTITSARDPLNRTVATSYTANGDVSSATNEAGGTSDNTYSTDGKNDLVKAEGPANSSGQRATSTYSYGDADNPYSPTAYTDGNGDSWQYSYDPTTGNTLSKGEGSGTAPGENAVTFTYNSDGTLATATDSRGEEWTYSYTNHNLTAVTPPSGSAMGTEKPTYDPLNRLSSVTDGKGNTTTYSYDDLDRVTHETALDPSGSLFANVSYAYDNDGNLTSQTDPSGTTNYAYDPLNRLTQETKPDMIEVGYGYDGAGNLTTLTDPSGTTTYGYDAANRITSIKGPSSPGSGSITYSYPDETHQTITYPNGASVSSTYDQSGRLISIDNKDACGASFASYGYDYAYTGASGAADGALRRSESATEAWPDLSGSSTTTYGYDRTGRLASASRTGTGAASYGYTYDSTGNRTSETVNGTTTYYAYGPANELCAEGSTSISACPSPWSFNFDANGSQVTSSGPTMTYNPLDQTAVIDGASHTYAGVDQVQETGSGTTQLLYDQLGIERRAKSTYTAYFTRDPSGRVLALRAQYSGGSFSNSYMAFDGLGSVVGMTNAAGTVDAHYAYDPYGNPISVSDANADYNPFRYAGYYLDYSSGTSTLYKAGMRFYDSSTGRWTQRDSINNPLDEHGWSPYDYAGDDPVDFVDPNGTSVLGFVKGFIRQTLIGAGAGALYGCTVGALAASELGPPGWLGGCLVSGLAGASIGAELAAADYLESYVGPIPRLRG